MPDFLQFIDSPDIREYNKETQFTPAEWAVLVSKSLTRTVEEKIDALEYLAGHYTTDEFQEETVWPEFGGFGYLQSFREGNIVKVDFPQTKVHYGVFPCNWKKPEEPSCIHMWASLEVYLKERKDFDYTDGEPYWDHVLGFFFCPDEELPEDEQVLKLIRAVRKGEMDFYTLLHKFSRNELDEMVEWFRDKRK